jgi:para-nitrobenzyl esterase
MVFEKSVKPGHMNKAIRIELLMIAALFSGNHFCTSGGADNAPVATTKAGAIRGYIDNSIVVFKNIPYGENTAMHRFKPPHPPAPWSGIRDAREFGPFAPQQMSGRDVYFPSPGKDMRISEDCLHVNVWTPALRDGRKRPVMVYFHGGAYSSSSSNFDMLDGVRLCRRGDVVLVTVNHRLNVFGYLYLAEIRGKEFAESGNAGMLDLVLALQWVRDNIVEFGGNPHNVTIFGQSGGGAKCATLMAMPAAKGLFHHVITESGQQLTGRTKNHATATALQVLKNLGLTSDQISALDTIPMQHLIEASRGYYFGPVTDSLVLPRDPFDPDASPLSFDVPMMMGNTHDETTVLIGGGDSTLFHLSWEEVPGRIQKFVKQFIGDLDPQSIVAAYRQWYPQYSPSDVFFAASTAARSWKGCVIESERRAKQNGAPTYVYQLNWQTPVNGGQWKAPHGLDIPLSFDNIAYCPSMVSKSAEAQTLADIMSEVWIAFARTGNPQTKAIPDWPRFNVHDRPTMIFDLQSRIEHDPRGKERKLFVPVLYIQPGT